jgi:flagellar hook protein FlgE
MASFSIPLSGLSASQAQLQAISSNLANVDTDGYKAQNLTFGDVFQIASSSNGAGDPLQPGGGVTVQSTYYNESDGTAVSTGLASNMALSGNGYFVVQQGDGSVAYSRAGDFSLTKDGQLTTNTGALVLGYPANAAPLQPLTIGTGTVLPATATSQFTTTTNLDASSAVGATSSAEISVYDSLGVSHQLTINYTKTAANTWGYTITAPAADGALTTTPNTAGQSTVTLASGSLSFNSSGVLASTTPISLASFTPSDGASALTINWNLADASGNSLVTQSDLASTTSASTQNGAASATLSNYTIESDGTIEGTFSTGKTLALGRVAVAEVANNQGLAHIGNNLYEVTAASGPASIGTAGTGGRGSIQGGYVEDSNVSVATEFSNMIVAQQAYQANAKSVTTFDQLMQATIGMLQA